MLEGRGRWVEGVWGIVDEVVELVCVFERVRVVVRAGGWERHCDIVRLRRGCQVRSMVIEQSAHLVAQLDLAPSVAAPVFGQVCGDVAVAGFEVGI